MARLLSKCLLRLSIAALIDFPVALDCGAKPFENKHIRNVAPRRTPGRGSLAAPAGAWPVTWAITRRVWLSPPSRPGVPCRLGHDTGRAPGDGAVSAHGSGPRDPSARCGHAGIRRRTSTGEDGRPSSRVRGNRWATSALTACPRVSSSSRRSSWVSTGSNAMLKAGTRSKRFSGV